jgi:acetyl-CoA carboxylase biotin carboxyl carrier protein
MAEDRSDEVTVAELIALVDRLEGLLERSALSELEVEMGGTALVLRKPGALGATLDPSVLASLAAAGQAPATARARSRRPASPSHPEPASAPASSGLHAVVAPLTGLYYASPAPGAAPYLKEGGHVSAGQVIGLIEAMKLFNEIKSDVTGIVRRIAVESGALVKAKTTLIEVEPA